MLTQAGRTSARHHWWLARLTLAALALGVGSAWAQSPALATVPSPPAWQPSPSTGVEAGEILVGERRFASLQHAASVLADHDRLDIGPGVYHEPLVIRADGVQVIGHGAVVIDGASAEGKAAIVNKGDGNRIRNIECRNIAVRHGNGACVRHEGRDLTLEHVWFHDAQQGLLSGGQPGRVHIRDSRFERLGHGGRAHGIYVGGGELHISHSQFLSGRDEGHEIKSRALSTLIEHSIIASLDGHDSRLIDVSQGGSLTIRRSVLEQGPHSSNRDLIGFALERNPHPTHRVELRENLVIVDDPRGGRLLHIGAGIDVEPVIEGNTVIGKVLDHHPGINLWLEDRADAGLPDYPALPPVPAD